MDDCADSQRISLSSASSLDPHAGQALPGPPYTLAPRWIVVEPLKFHCIGDVLRIPPLRISSLSAPPLCVLFVESTTAIPTRGLLLGAHVGVLGIQ